MAETRINLCGDKYTIIHDNGACLRAERYAEPWRDLTGDGLVLSAAQRIEELEAALRVIAAIKTPRMCMDGSAVVGSPNATGYDFAMIARHALKPTAE